MIEMSEVHAAGRTLGIDMVSLETRREEDIAPAFDAIKTKTWADALYVVLDPIMNAHRVRINILAVGVT